MTSKTLAQLFADLRVAKSRSRPHVWNGNPFIESHFKALKDGPTFPGYFANGYQARDFCRRFFAWYNGQHRNTGIALLTPEDVHRGRVEEHHAVGDTVTHYAADDAVAHYAVGDTVAHYAVGDTVAHCAVGDAVARYAVGDTVAH